MQYLAIRYTERLADAGALTSVGSRGDKYDNARAESFHGLFKAELIRKDGPWRGLGDIEYKRSATSIRFGRGRSPQR